MPVAQSFSLLDLLIVSMHHRSRLNLVLCALVLDKPIPDNIFRPILMLLRQYVSCDMLMLAEYEDGFSNDVIIATKFVPVLYIW